MKLKENHTEIRNQKNKTIFYRKKAIKGETRKLSKS